MDASQHYRDSAAECLLAAQGASQTHRRELHLSMAISWLSLARQYEAIERLFQGTERPTLSKEPTTELEMKRRATEQRKRDDRAALSDHNAAAGPTTRRFVSPALVPARSPAPSTE
jgi:hypothetical protein